MISKHFIFNSYFYKIISLIHLPLEVRTAKIFQEYEKKTMLTTINKSVSYNPCQI